MTNRRRTFIFSASIFALATLHGTPAGAVLPVPGSTVFDSGSAEALVPSAGSPCAAVSQLAAAAEGGEPLTDAEVEVEVAKLEGAVEGLLGVMPPPPSASLSPTAAELDRYEVWGDALVDVALDYEALRSTIAQSCPTLDDPSAAVDRVEAAELSLRAVQDALSLAATDLAPLSGATPIASSTSLMADLIAAQHTTMLTVIANLRA